MPADGSRGHLRAQTKSLFRLSLASDSRSQVPPVLVSECVSHQEANEEVGVNGRSPNGSGLATGAMSCPAFGAHLRNHRETEPLLRDLSLGDLTEP